MNAAAVREVDLRKKYRYTPIELAQKLGLNTNESKTLRDMLKRRRSGHVPRLRIRQIKASLLFRPSFRFDERAAFKSRNSRKTKIRDQTKDGCFRSNSTIREKRYDLSLTLPN